MTYFSPFTTNGNTGAETIMKQVSAADVGPRIRSVREARGFAHRIDVYEPLGIGASNYSRYENGQVLTPVNVICAIARFLDCPVDYLLTGSTEYMPYELKVKLGLNRG